VRILVTKAFRRFQRKEQIGDTALIEAIQRATSGLIDADLGGGLIKQRVARPGRGRSSGYRTIIAFHDGERAVFLFGFAKNSIANIDAVAQASWRAVAVDVLSASDDSIDAAISARELRELTS
jgi:hypothetical protein